MTGMKKWKRLKKRLILTVKIAAGSSLAIGIAQNLQLDYAISAGTITLLTLMTTKWETVKLSVFRLVTFLVSVITAWIAFAHIDSICFSYGVFIFIIVFLSETMGLRATISVNSVIGAHLLTSHNFTVASIWNEFLLVVIGVSIALFLNLFHDNHNREKDIIADMRYTEGRLQSAIRNLADYLSDGEIGKEALDGICKLEEELHEFLKEAYEFQENTFQSHPGYYIDYFEMRQGQCRILHDLYFEMKKIQSIPEQAVIVANYMLYLADYVIELNEPSKQMDRLNSIFDSMAAQEMPITRTDFESRAILYHILMDLEEFLAYKSRFIKSLNEKQLDKYWN